MKLGIVVVYLVKAGDEALLDLHLRQIARCTTVPYTIYAAVNRLSAAGRARLAQDPHVRVCDCTATELRGGAENAWYLEHLTRLAADDGVTHLATFHVDSFPVREGWAKELAAGLSDTCPLAAVERLENGDHKPHAAFMLLTQAFYLRERPHYLPTERERRSPRYLLYALRHPHVRDTGSGYGYRLYQRGLAWRPLLRSNAAEDHYLLGSVYGDMIFHLGAAARNAKVFAGDGRAYREARLVGGLRRGLGRLLPSAWRDSLRGRGPLLSRRARLRNAENSAAYDVIRDRLLADPDGYLRYLSTGQEHAA